MFEIRLTSLSIQKSQIEISEKINSNQEEMLRFEKKMERSVQKVDKKVSTAEKQVVF